MRTQNFHTTFTRSYVVAHHKISSSIKGQQETNAATEGDGEVSALPNLRRHPLPACQLGPAQRSGEYRHKPDHRGCIYTARHDALVRSSDTHLFFFPLHIYIHLIIKVL